MFKINKLNNEHLTLSQVTELYEITLLERFWLGLGIFFVALLSILDLIEDIETEPGGLYLFVDIAYLVSMLAVLGYLWRFLPLTLRQTNIVLTTQVIEKHKDIEKWKQKASDTMKGFSQLISIQFNDWGFSKAEKEVALLLLKGLSIKEISHVRGTSPGTIRQQATSLYEKAKIGGRAELSAFFLEDVLLVSPEQESSALQRN